MNMIQGAVVRRSLLASAAALAMAGPQLAYAQDVNSSTTRPPVVDPASTTPPQSEQTGVQTSNPRATATPPSSDQTSGQADAQNGQATANGDIVVTASRRNALLSEVPISISVVSADTLQRDQIQNITDLNGRLPSVVIGQQYGGARIAIRGVGFNPIRPGDEGRIAFYTDGAYIARPSAQIGTLFDVDRIEVLRGPQGTLYGRNATGGAVLLTTRDPTKEFSGYLDTTVGNYDSVQVAGAISGPITSTLSARLAFETVNRDGYWFNQVTQHDVGGVSSQSIRATILWEPSPKFNLRISADRHSADDSNYVVHGVEPGLIAGNPLQILYGSRDIASSYDPVNELETYGGTIRATFIPNEHLTLTATGGYRRVDSRVFVPGIPGRITSAISEFRDDSDQYTADVVLSGDYGPVNFVLGASYFREDQTPFLRSAVRGRLFSPAAPDIITQGTYSQANLIADAYALFGEVTFDITSRLSVTGGLRYSWETKQALGEINVTDLFTPFPSAQPNTDFGFLPACVNGVTTNCVALRPGFPRNSTVDFDSLTPKVAVNYEFTPNISAYATYVEGFKSGGFNYGTIQAPYNPETIKNYEIGLRARVFDNRLTLRAAAFRYDYSALQQTVQIQSAVGTFVLNTGDARIQGIEAEFRARLTDNFQIDGNVSVLDSEFGAFTAVDPNTGQAVNIGGLQVPQAPEFAIYLGAEYGFDIGAGRLTLRGDWRRTGETQFDLFNKAFAAQEAYDVFGANATYAWGDGRWRAGAFIKNIGNQYATSFRNIQANSLGGGATGTLIAPRTFGLTLGYNFR